MRPMPPIWAMPASWGARRLLLGNGPGWSAFRPAPSTSAGGALCTPGGSSLPPTASRTKGKASGWRPEATTWAGTTSPAGCGRSTSTRSTTPRPTTTTWRFCSCATPSPTAGSTPPSACRTATLSRTTACGTAALSPAGASPNPAQITAPLSCWTSRWPWWTGHSACGGCTPSPGTWCALGSRRAAGMPARGTAGAP